MRSLIIGIARTGSPTNYLLNPDMKYISMCGNKPEVNFSIDCGQYDFNRMANGLRYNDADPDASAEAITFFSQLTTKLAADLKYLIIDENDHGPLHIRIVTTPFELSQIPFEFVLSPYSSEGDRKIPLLVHPERRFILTREVRQERESGYLWPHRPRILFVWAEPEVALSVPHTEHLKVLMDVIRPLARPISDIPALEPDSGKFLTELPAASISEIRKTIDQGIAEKTPFTHIHILAHGGQTEVFGAKEFRLLLCKTDGQEGVHKVDGKTLAAALVPEQSKFAPALVTLAVCDSGHIGSTILPSGNLAYQLHTNGIPCVFASQFPLTQNGSVFLTHRLYSLLISGCDPRIALYETRVGLYQAQNHDWASLVAYARFPEDIDEQLLTVQLKMLFDSMKVANSWVDHVFKFWETLGQDEKKDGLEQLDVRLQTSISALSGYLDKSDGMRSTLSTPNLQSEHLGLLGSAYKRKAEYLYRLTERNPEKGSELIKESIACLKHARAYYRGGVTVNPANHWTILQYLSLKAILEGTLHGENELWYVAKFMAERDKNASEKQEDRIWALGTLSELYLLKPLLCPGETSEKEINDSLATAKEYISSLNALDSVYSYVRETTARQFKRYIQWWPALSAATYPAMLKSNAEEILNELVMECN